jgi:hypothetical protein
VVFIQQPAVGRETASATPVQPQNERPNLGQITGTRPAFSLAGLTAVKLKPFTPRVGAGAAGSTVPYGAPAPPATPAAEATEGNPDVCRQLFPAKQAPVEVDGAALALAAPVSAPAAAASVAVASPAADGVAVAAPTAPGVVAAAASVAVGAPSAASVAVAAPVAAAPTAAPAAAGVAAATDDAEDKENGGAAKVNALAPAGEKCWAVMCCMRVVAAGPALTLTLTLQCWAVVCSMRIVLLALRTCCPLLCAFGVAISPLLGPLPRQHCNSLLLSPSQPRRLLLRSARP